LAMPELAAIVKDCGARVLLTDRDPGPLAGSFERVLSIPHDYETLLASAPQRDRAVVEDNALAALFYTGGTTGLPKGVMLTDRNRARDLPRRGDRAVLRRDRDGVDRDLHAQRANLDRHAAARLVRPCRGRRRGAHRARGRPRVRARRDRRDQRTRPECHRRLL